MRRNHRKRKYNKQKRTIIITSFVLLISLSVGYSAFSTNINLNVKGNINATPSTCFTVTDNGDGTGTITDYDKTCGSKVIIPSKINNLTITKLADLPIDANTTKGFVNKNITKVILPDTLTYIGNMSFFSDKLTEIKIPSNVTYIGQQAFSGNSIMGELILPNGLKTIEQVAFYGNNITKVTIPSSVTFLGQGAFTNNNLEGNGRFVPQINNGITDYKILNSYASKQTDNIIIPNYIEKLMPWSFGGLTIKYIEIPSNVRIIYNETFSNTKLTTLKLNEGLQEIGANTFIGSTLNTISLPSTITNINSSAFARSNITTININKKQNAIEGAPWGAKDATVNWTSTD